MKVHRSMPWLAAGLVGALAVAGASYGGSSTPVAAKAPASVKVGLVTDTGGLNDRGFNQLANKGRLQADKLKGISTRVLISRSSSDYIPNLASLAQNDFDLVIGVGFLMEKEIETVANRFPNTKFAIIDASQVGMATKPKNLRGLLFKEQETGCLVGALGALVIKGRGQQVMSSVGGIKIPPVDRFIAGYQFCAKRITPRISTLNAYSQSFGDQAKCKEIALNQIAAGSQVVFQVAGQCGLGALDAADERGKWGIGVDADQAFKGQHVLTSALKKVDVAVFKTARAVKNGTFRGGGDTTFGVKAGGVGLGKVSPRLKGKKRTTILAQVKRIENQIKSGKLKIPATVRG